MFWIVFGVFAILCIMLGYVQSIRQECSSLALNEGPTIISFHKRFIRICYCAVANGFCGILVTYNAKIFDQIYHDITQQTFYQIPLGITLATTIIFIGVHFLTNQSISFDIPAYKYDRRAALLQTVHMIFLFLYSFVAYYLLTLLCANILL